MRKRADVVDRTRVVRERRYPPSVDLAYVITFLRQTRATGTLSLDLTQGTVACIRFEESHKVAFQEKSA